MFININIQTKRKVCTATFCFQSNPGRGIFESRYVYNCQKFIFYALLFVKEIVDFK